MIQLSILTPRRVCLSTSVESVLIPSSDGQFGVLKGHCPIVTSFQSGILQYRIGPTTYRVDLKDGFVKVQNDVVTVLSRFAESLEDSKK
jgi:F-type H+-transporting ATPase subunit epsilon